MKIDRSFGRLVGGATIVFAVAAALSVTAVGAPLGATTLPTSTIAMSRIAGPDRFATAVALAKAAYPTTAHTVFIATGTNYPDALAAGPVAAHLGGPLLLTDPLTLPASVAAELTSLAPSTVVVLGGPTAVSSAVRAEVASAVPTAHIDPISGTDRFATALAIVSYGFSTASSVFLATGNNYPDALSAAGAAGAAGAPVVLVDGGRSSLSTQTTDLLSRLGTAKVTIVGGPTVVSAGIEASLDSRLGSAHVQRLAGADRYATSALVATSTFARARSALIATGTNFPDALAGAVLAGSAKEPLFLVPSTCVPPDTLGAFRRLSLASSTLIGGPTSVSDTVGMLATCSNVPAQPTVTPARILAPVSIDPYNWPYASLDRVHCTSSSSCTATGHLAAERSE